MKKVKSLKALVLSLMLCLAMGTTAFASEVSTQGQAAPNANKAVEAVSYTHLTLPTKA